MVATTIITTAVHYLDPTSDHNQIQDLRVSMTEQQVATEFLKEETNRTSDIQGPLIDSQWRGL